MATKQFRTPSGIGVPAVTAEEMRRVDRIATDEVGIELLQMMENAGRNLAEYLQYLGYETVTVCTGNGGNGGGGLACARHAVNHGLDVSVLTDRPVGKLDGAAGRQRDILDAMGVQMTAWSPDRSLPESDVVVDALVGYGLSGTVREPLATLLRRLNDAPLPVVSLDVPSGRDATTGEVLGTAVAPEHVLTLALPKTGLVRLDAALQLADISVPAAVYEHTGIEYKSPFVESYRVALSPDRGSGSGY